jgi:thioester reductase-like protein
MTQPFKRIADLSALEKRELLVQLLQKRASKPLSLLEQFAVPATEMDAEAILDPAISPDGLVIDRVTEPAHIFLTGATGFLGAFLLYELLEHTQADIYCLVRSHNAEDSKDKLQRTLEYYSLSHESLSSRVIPVVGDLAEPLFGLSPQQFGILASTIDVIYHSGAAINWIYPYERLKRPNVLGTQEVLRLASQIKLKAVHFISTLAVFPLLSNTNVKIVREQDSLDHGGDLYGGYVQSKWVADKLVAIASSRGLPVCIYRPGLITGHSQTGAWNTDDVTCRMLKTWIELGRAPDLDFEKADMTPVDFVSKAIVHLSRQHESVGKTFHLVNPHPIHMREIVTWIRSFGYQLRQVPYDHWLAELLDPARHSRDDAIYSLVPLFSLSVSDKVPTMVRRMPALDCRNTLNGLAGTSIVCPPIDGEVFTTYLSYIVRSGFLDPPPSGGTLSVSTATPRAGSPRSAS